MICYVCMAYKCFDRVFLFCSQNNSLQMANKLRIATEIEENRRETLNG